MKALGDDYRNDEIEHFSYYDHLQKSDDCGIWSDLKEALQEIKSDHLLGLLRQHGEVFSGYAMDLIQREIETRLLKKFKEQ